jgi:hepatocyte growth factor-regulated tyrosine kinase substrate
LPIDYCACLGYYESLQDKLSQLKDAREALNALRDEHQENRKRQAFERERQRQIQLAVKLDDMRQKKQVHDKMMIC